MPPNASRPSDWANGRGVAEDVSGVMNCALLLVLRGGTESLPAADRDCNPSCCHVGRVLMRPSKLESIHQVRQLGFPIHHHLLDLLVLDFRFQEAIQRSTCLHIDACAGQTKRGHRRALPSGPSQQAWPPHGAFCRALHCHPAVFREEPKDGEKKTDRKRCRGEEHSEARKICPNPYHQVLWRAEDSKIATLAMMTPQQPMKKKGELPKKKKKMKKKKKKK